jgi:uncharacterized membrane protein
MMNHGYYGVMGGGLWIWTVAAVVVVALLVFMVAKVSNK